VPSHSWEREMHTAPAATLGDIEIEAMILARPCSRMRTSQKTRMATMKKHMSVAEMSVRRPGGASGTEVRGREGRSSAEHSARLV
jgi:hypothetical protein